MIFKTLCAGLLFTMLCSPAWAINKCTGPDGKVAYQDEPCANNAKVATIAKAAPLNTTSEKERQALKTCGLEVLPELPAIGWSEDKFLACSLYSLWGTPIINSTETAKGSTKQFVFRYYRAYVYTRNGVVTAVQHQ